MKMDDPSPASTSVVMEDGHDLPTSTTANTTGNDEDVRDETVLSTTDSNTDDGRNNNSNGSKTDSNGGGNDVDEDNLLNYIAELAGGNVDGGESSLVVEDEILAEDELLGDQSSSLHESISDKTPPTTGSISKLVEQQRDRNGRSPSKATARSIADQTSGAKSLTRPPIDGRQSTALDATDETVKKIDASEPMEQSNGNNEDDDDHAEETGRDEASATTEDKAKEIESSPSNKERPVENGEADVSNTSETVNSNDGEEPMEIVEKKTEAEADSVDKARDALLERFYAYCQKFRTISGSLSADSVRERFRLTDLLKWFLDEEGRPGPLTFRKRLVKTGFSLPISITMPPSQVVDFIAERAADKSLKDIYGGRKAVEETPEAIAMRQQFSRYAAPNMTRFLYDIGYNLVSEATYRTALTRAVTELSGSSRSADAVGVQRQADMVEHIRRVYDDVKKQNQSLKLKLHRCPIDYCDFAAETKLQLHDHQRQPHKKTHRWECAICRRFSSWSDEDMDEHYQYEHGFTSSAIWDLPPSKAACPMCEQDFQYKQQLKLHLRECPMMKEKKLTSGKDDELDVLNLRLWPKVDERRTPAPVQKPQLPKALPAMLRPMTKDVHGYSKKSGPPSARVANVVSEVASGSGQLRPPPPLKPQGLTTMRPPTLQQQLYTSSGFGPRPAARLMLPQQQRVQASSSNPFVRQLQVAQSRVQQQRNRMPPPPPLTPQSPAVQSFQSPTQRGVQAPHSSGEHFVCEICDGQYHRKFEYLKHLQNDHRKLLDKSEMDLIGAAPLACSRCRDRFYSYEGLERHLLMQHGLVTNELLSKAQKRQDSGKCKICTKIYAFNLLQHLVQDHGKTLCSAEIVYSCDVCHFQCNSYLQLELHLKNHHTENSTTKNVPPLVSGYVQQQSNRVPAIAQNQQASPRFGQQTTTTRLLPHQQTAASILHAALNGPKRPAGAAPIGPMSKMNGSSGGVGIGVGLRQPSKLSRLGIPGARKSVVNVHQQKPAVARPQQHTPGARHPSSTPASNNRPSTSSANTNRHSATSQKKQLRYCCTPCDLKFVSYEMVLKHWVERHLKPLRVPVCRIEQCEPCREELSGKRKKKEEDTIGDGEASGTSGDADGGGPSSKIARLEDEKEEGDGGLILDLELPEYEPEVEIVDDDVQVIPCSDEVITLD